LAGFFAEIFFLILYQQGNWLISTSYNPFFSVCFCFWADSSFGSSPQMAAAAGR